ARLSSQRPLETRMIDHRTWRFRREGLSHSRCAINDVVEIPRRSSAMPKRKSWREKLADSKDLPKVVPIAGAMSRRLGEGTVAIPAPADVDAIMKQVPWGRLTTINEIRARIAQEHGATIGCPLTTGIFAWIAAHAAQEAADL